MKGNPPGRRCAFRKPDGTACRAKPLHNIDLCFWHDPEHKEEDDKARQLGGQRRRRESTLAGAYDVEGLTSTGEIRRLLEVAAYDTLALDSSVPRSRALVAMRSSSSPASSSLPAARAMAITWRPRCTTNPNRRCFRPARTEMTRLMRTLRVWQAADHLGWMAAHEPFGGEHGR